MKNKIPTLEEVKEHFKNAKEVRCLGNDMVYDIEYIGEDPLLKASAFWIGNVLLWWKGECAKIISYKDFEEAGEVKKEAFEKLQARDQFQKIGESMASLLKYKNEKYGNAVLEPINIFSGKCKAGTRLDDKLSRIKNNNKLLKNDVSDLIGYLMLTCIENGWDNFDEFKD